MRAIALLVVAACHTPVPPAAPRADRDTAGDMVDSIDKCLTIPEGCPGTQDEDGCPDVMLPTGPNCALPPDTARQLGEAASQIKDAGAIVLRVVSGSAACATAVRDDLLRRGVAPAALETRTSGTGTDVWFEVAVWKGAPCR